MTDANRNAGASPDRRGPGRDVEAAEAGEATALRRFFLGAGLPVFLLTAVALYEAFLVVLVFAPETAGWWGEFARDFKLWCFSYDPRTGGMEWSAVGMMLLEPLFVVGVAVLLWRRALGALRSARSWAGQWRAALGGVAAVGVAIGALLAYARPAGEEPLPPFPGERIRTRIAPPAFRLTDQLGRELALEDLRGRVVLITGIYAACAVTCPQILVETRELLDSLPPGVRERVSVVALSLNPEYETTEIMAALASGYGFRHPEFRYLNGAPEPMHALLEQFQFGRYRNPQTGAIEHANLLMLVDAHGKIAFRFNLNPRHRAWLREGVRLLAVEAEALAAAAREATDE